MTIPTASLYPDALDSDTNLYLVHDSLRLTLATAYNPGDTSVEVIEDATTMARFPPTGQITLTEQCSDIDERAISFYYNSRTDTTFDGLEILPNFEDVFKPKLITHVTQNVMSDHHDNIKNAVIAVEEFAGVKGTIDIRPFGTTLEGRTNFIRKIALTPRAWFVADRTVGIVPFTVTFTDQSFRLTSDPECEDAAVLQWDFGDNISNISIISVTASGSIVHHTYTTPGIYDVILEVTNDFGTDTVVFPEMIDARIAAPDEAAIEFIPRTGQILTPGVPSGGPYTTPPKIRATIGQVLSFEVPPGENPNTSGVSYAGEVLDGSGSPIDPILNYTWVFSDDLPHSPTMNANASYSVGGLYDLVLRVDTQLHAYRITDFIKSIDIVEKTNMWLWNFTSTTDVQSYEFGLISETFKVKTNTTKFINRNTDFLESEPNSEQQIREFNRNNGFAPRSLTQSGNQGTAALFWATGRDATDPVSTEKISFTEYNAFSDTYMSTISDITRPWNWVALSSPSSVYFALGYPTGSITPNTSPTNQTKTTLNLSLLSTSNQTLTLANYLNGAQELMSNVSIFDGFGDPVYGHFSAYRTAWKDQTGYIIRNDGVGPFFRLKSFYKTEGTLGNPFVNIRKLPDMPGATKVEGQLVPLSSGVFFFNNSGAISAYNDTSGVWETSSTAVNSGTFRLLQDTTVTSFDDPSNTLLAASDSDRKAYISFDYSSNAFMKFNEADLTFSTLGSRPTGDQWLMGIY